ncbi:MULTISPECIES: helix-turn-helix transcriptional regulator [Niastella]|uniref:WYL domain-containing protein n=1 Tax=Niastella soli TaxID=2821487 RepID=A0ABS3YNA1_9BACT|nr:WYL domain-containing protein [Niastella soli]MBO9199369.1 WYL domain-containing protein [Niastella soli]
MSVNKLALIRYKTIDDCLRNRYRKWTLEDLIVKVADVLYELEGITTGVSKRTIQADIQIMRSDKLGYNAPIIVVDRKFYSYSDPEYSITNAPVNQADVEKMKEIVGVLKQFNGFTYFDEMSDMIARLENNLYRTTHQGRNYIQFENNHLLKGLEHINPLYQAILNKRSLLVEYKSFKAAASQHIICYPYLLKEYRNRWFLIGRAKKRKVLLTMALDRIIEFQELSKETFYEEEGIDFDHYFDNLIGVTKNENDKTNKVVLFVNNYNAPYVLTKPLHHSQQLLKKDENGIVIRIDVVMNFELEREILGFGECMKVLAPRILKSKIKKRLQNAMGAYEEEKEEDTKE